MTSIRTDADISIIAPNQPGRLGDDSLRLNTDPRSDPRLVAVLEQFGLAGATPPSPVTVNSDLAEIYEWLAQAEPQYEALFEALYGQLEPLAGVDRFTETITGVDGNEITLYVHKPANPTGPVPCIVHTHGGGMTILRADNLNYVHWRDSLAAAGLAVVGVEFRNAGASLGNHPFPAGLNDCASGAEWAIANLDRLGASHIVMSGESGGGNLAIATTLLAKRDGWVNEIKGVYAQCPYISGQYDVRPATLPSLFENDDYFLACDMMAAMARPYDPDGSHATDPLAWPLHATAEDLELLPPAVISVNELDPLRDEGLEFYRQLLAAGVPAVSRTVNGTCHAGDCLFPEQLSDVYAATIADIANFARSVAPS